MEKATFRDKFEIDEDVEWHGSFLMKTTAMPLRFTGERNKEGERFTGRVEEWKENKFLSMAYEFVNATGKKLLPKEAEELMAELDRQGE